VKPDDTKPLDIIAGKDYCTLVTCTPYGINSHRLLVRGVRVAYDETTMAALRVTPDASKTEPILLVPIIASPILIVLLVVLLVSTGRKKGSINQITERKETDSGFKK
jgi:sortase A